MVSIVLVSELWLQWNAATTLKSHASLESFVLTINWTILEEMWNTRKWSNWTLQRRFWIKTGKTMVQGIERNTFARRKIFFISYLVTFSRLIEHFQMAPVAAASNSLFSILNDRDTRGSRPPYFRTRSRVSSSSAHWKQVQASIK